MHETAPEESYGKGHLTFDCPWCGAISGIDPSHLGEHYTCPECHRATKLTDKTTRHAPVTQAAPDAPPHEERPVPWALVGGGLAVVAAVVVAVVLLGGPKATDEEGGTAAAGGGTTPAPETPAPEAPPPEPETGPGEATPPPDEVPEPQPPEVVPSVDVEALRARVATARAGLAEAVAAHDTAHAALAAWREANPEAAHEAALAEAGRDALAASRRLRAALDPASLTPAEARSFNDAVRAHVAEDPHRSEVAGLLVVALSRDLPKPVIAESWTAIDFCVPRVERLLGGLVDGMLTRAPEEHAALAHGVRQAAAAKEQAERALAEAIGEMEAAGGAR